MACLPAFSEVVGPVGLEPTTKGFTSPAVSGGSGLSLHPQVSLVGCGTLAPVIKSTQKLSGSLCTVRRCTAGLAQDCRCVTRRATVSLNSSRPLRDSSPWRHLCDESPALTN